ncbi:PaaI family thioesterase [Salicibibacter kimchii]|uniref:PaaI family thioesterase n=1 Tax=Salicibibacter kimchii TaxID=2099786 RepID=UPI001357A417|nr:PaaI family thioesterase [Salicibibacter kimchii]
MNLANESHFFNHVGFEMIEAEDGAVTIVLDIDDKHMNRNDTLHGGVHATMLDNVLGAVLHHRTELPSTTVSLNVNYLAPVKKGRLTARATILQLGYKSATVEGVIADAEGTAIAKGTGTFKILRKG